ncbi:putative pentatricopeptide repeat-containing protein At3g05240 [Humulus lupulus]|uniref:putative pentatricopeptide repeat-containing protein At3g05240 n=1 Tax=Humulus lupulus TaxID=3486 RepID=UPI002B4138E0|nr:putative pentatricopeptide repeat-containing protein At3g05240 [Humulus lupulus]
MKKSYDTILCLLEKCKTMAELKQLHGLMITTSVIKNRIPLSKIIDFCVSPKTGDFHYARSVFSQIAQPNHYIWNSMIRGYSFSDNPIESLIMYKDMQQMGIPPDNFTFPFVLKACSIIGDQGYGRSVHNRIVKTGFEFDVYASTALLHMYACCSDMEAGLKAFDKVPKWNVVAWTSLISGLVNNNRFGEALKAFRDMEDTDVEPNEITLVNVLVACARSRDLETGKWVHDRIRHLGYDPFVSSQNFNVILATAIVDMYAKCGNLETAKNLFDKMPQRNSVAWNSMIAAYNQYGQAEGSLDLFLSMQIAELVPDQATFLGVLGACAHLGALILGQSLHAYISKTKWINDLAVGTAFVDMYAKVGDPNSAWKIFNNLQKKDVKAWTTMILGFAVHGKGMEALKTFKTMQEDGNVVPDEITYIGVLFACSHVGLVNEGQRHFDEMRSVHGIVPTLEHYGCLVDLLSRAGRLKEAMRLVEEMPIKPNINIWGAILNGCEIYENVDLADKVRSQITKLEPQGSGVYVLLSNIYARAGRWQEVNLARELMKQKTINKTIGHSSVEMK